MSDELWNNPELQQLSQTSTHYSQEEERQSQKLRKRAARESFSIHSSSTKKKQRPPKSIEQLKHQKEYTRIKYKKTTNYTNELDVNGSIEYLVRKRLNSKSEQKRLRRVVKERYDKRLHLDDEEEPSLSALDGDINGKIAAAAKSSPDNDYVNWNYINEGYTTMPNYDAQKLSYYVYNNNNHNGRKRKRMQQNKAMSKPSSSQSLQQKRMGAIPEEEEEVHSSSSLSSTSTSTSRGRGSGGPRYKTSLEVAARSGCTKCTMELESGIHVKSLHDMNCPRKKKSRRRKGAMDTMLLDGSNPMMEEMNSSTKFGTTNSSKPKRKKRKYIKQSQKPPPPKKYEPDNNTLPRSFPLHFNASQSSNNNRNDLYQGINKQTKSGLDKLVFRSGRNVKRLWVRLVAGGNGRLDDELSDSDDEDEDSNTNNSSIANKKEQDTKKEEKEEEKKDSDSISKMSSNSSTSSLQSSSSSSSSSNDSYVEPISQLTNTTSIIDTTIIDTANQDEDDEDIKSKRNKGKKDNPTLRLMEMVHSLPKDTYRNSYILKIGQELGANRLLWEDKIQPLLKSAAVDVEGGSGEMGTTLASQLKALKSFLGVDGNTIHSPPLWMCDPSLSTNPIALRDYMNKLRRTLLKNVKEWSKQKRLDAANLTLEEGTKSREETTTNEIQEEVEGTTADDEDEVHAEATTTKIEDINNEMFDSSQVKGEEGDPDELTIPNTSFKPLKSLLDTQKTQPTPGGIDKYAKFIHEAKIDISNVNVALAWFMAQLTSSKAKLIQAQQQQHQTDASQPSSSQEEDRTTLIKEAQEEVNQWNESIQSYLQLVESLTSVRDAQFYKCGDLYPQCAPLATAVMASQSYIANGGGSTGSNIVLGGEKRHDPFNVKSEEEYDEDEEEETELTLDEQVLHQIHLSATDISRRGRDQNKHLTSFTPIHLTTGIAMITEILLCNSQAVELISKSCCPDSLDNNNRTPFDLVRNMITLIEEDGILISAPDMMGYIDTRNKIIDEVLVKAVRDASMVFRKCIKCDPEDVNHWSWYVATMLGMLRIAYGSFTSSIDGSNVKEEEEHDEEPRTPRYRLECFDEIRCNASVALNDFLKFTQDHGCPMFHLASTSMLEWDKAMLLLHRPQCLSEFGLDVRRLHAYHTYQWATKVNTTFSITKVRQLCEANLLPRDALLDLLARTVEKNPCRRENWVHLVNALGRVDAIENDNNECLHSHEPTDQERRDWWWGKDRVSTWKEEFFNLPKSATQAVKPEFVRIVSQVVESVSVDSPSGHNNKDETLKEGTVSMPNPDECMEWIWDPQDTSDVDYDESNLYNNLLPTNTSSKEASQAQEELVHSMEILHHPTCEAMCMKIVVASHLLGVWHPFVCNSIWLLSVKLWQSQQQTISDDKSNAYAEGLALLKLHGIDASVYIQCRLKQSE